MARAVEGAPVLVVGDRAAEVRAVLGEDRDLAFVLDDEPAEGQVAGGVVAAAVAHDERRVRAGWGEDPGRRALLKLVERGVESDLDLPLLLALRRCGPEVDQDRQQARDHGGRHEGCEPPAEKYPAGGL